MEEARLQEAIREVRAGDPDALAEIWGAYARRVRGLCRRLLGSAESAEDATTEIFLKIQRSMSTYDATRPFTGWLLGVASNHCLDQLRRRTVEKRIFDTEALEYSQPSSTGPGPLAEVLAAEERRAVRRAVEDLPDKYRIPLVMRYYGGLSYDEIAGSTGLTRNNVATLLFRAKKMLRKALEESPDPETPDPEERTQ